MQIIRKRREYKKAVIFFAGTAHSTSARAKSKTQMRADVNVHIWAKKGYYHKLIENLSVHNPINSKKKKECICIFVHIQTSLIIPSIIT